MIDESKILNKIQEYAESTTGKRKMKQRIKQAVDGSAPIYKNAQIIDEAKMQKMANDLVRMIQKRIPKSIRSTGSTLTASAPVKKQNGSYIVTLSFDQDSLHRDSLENSLGYDGIRNIVAMFNNGVHAEHYVYGYWNGHKRKSRSVLRSKSDENDFAWIRSEKDREALYFMQDAEAEFNQKYGDKYNVTVSLGADYLVNNATNGANNN